MRRILTAILLLTSVTTVASVERTAHADGKIAYVDIQRALAESEEGKKAVSRLRGDFEKKQKELDARLEELKKMKETIDKQAPMLKPEALQQKTQELQQKFMALQETYGRLQKDLDEKQGKEMQKLGLKMQGIIAQVAQAEGYAYVMDKNAIVFGPPSLDLTNEVIRKFNAAPPAK